MRKRQDGERAGPEIVCDSCGYTITENRGIKAGDPCPECERGGMIPLHGERPVPVVEPRIVAECWTCTLPNGGPLRLEAIGLGRYHPKTNPGADYHRAAGHDVRPVRES